MHVRATPTLYTPTGRSCGDRALRTECRVVTDQEVGLPVLGHGLKSPFSEI